MKKFNPLTISIFLLIIFGCNKSEEKSSAPQANCLPTNLQTGILAFYPFSSGSLNDYSGNNYNLTNPTTASSGQDRDGNPNCAFNFVSANGDFLKYSNPTFIDNFQTLPFSISLWYKPIGTWSYECLIGRDTGLHCPNTFGQWSVSLYDGRKPVFGINKYDVWFEPAVYNASDFTGVWQHLVVTCQGNDLKVYRNGILATELPQLGSCNPPSPPTLNIGDLFLGKQYTGLLDDVIIYDRILSVGEVNDLYNLPACCQ
jgi:hypothetical protein